MDAAVADEDAERNVENEVAKVVDGGETRRNNRTPDHHRSKHHRCNNNTIRHQRSQHGHHHKATIGTQLDVVLEEAGTTTKQPLSEVHLDVDVEEVAVEEAIKL